MRKMKLTCFADEISSDLHEQLDVLNELGISHLEVRNVWGKNILEIDDEQLETVASMLKIRGFHVSSIASPIGKYAITDDFTPQIVDLDKAILIAKKLGTTNIRIFSYYVPQDEPKGKFRDEVLDRMKQLTEMAERNQITLILENDSQLYGTSVEAGLEIFEHCSSANLQAAFDPGNYVIEGIAPMDDAYVRLKDYVSYIHIKDAFQSPRQFVPAGEGDGQIERLLQTLQERQYEGYLSIEPHLKRYMPEASNEERVVTAAHALMALLDRNEIAWH